MTETETETLWQHTDRDGDCGDLVSPYPGEAAQGVLAALRAPAGVYLDWSAAVSLRDALTRLLADAPAPSLADSLAALADEVARLARIAR